MANKVKRYIAVVDPYKNCIDFLRLYNRHGKRALHYIPEMAADILARLCNACLNLLLKDWREKRSTKHVIDKSKNIVKHIRTPQCATVVILIHSPNLGLKMTEFTRFTTNFPAIDGLVKVRMACYKWLYITIGLPT